MNKPQDFTSFDVIAKLPGVSKIKDWVMQVRSTLWLQEFFRFCRKVLQKACDIIPDTAKSYTAGFRLGCISDTQDSSGSLSNLSPI